MLNYFVNQCTLIRAYDIISGTTIRTERISPEVIFLRPPERFVIELRVSGDYEVLFWSKDIDDGSSILNVVPQDFPNFAEIFVRDNTTADDLGVYIVSPQLKTGTSQTHTLIPFGVEFAVTTPGNLFLLIFVNYVYIHVYICEHS